jgi:hypothetical protein
MTKGVFETIYAMWAPIYERKALHNRRIPYSSRRRTRVANRCLVSRVALFLVLRYMAVGTHLDDLCMLCGATPAVTSRSFWNGLISLVLVLRRWNIAKIAFPNLSQALDIVENVQKQVPTIARFVGCVDGTVIGCERPGDYSVQQHYYNGMKKHHAIKALLVFLFTGEIAAAIYNLPGTVHDARAAMSLQIEQKMQHLPINFVIAGDTAFAFTNRVVRNLNEVELSNLSPIERFQAENSLQLFKKLRLPAEWGIGLLTRTWQALSKIMPADDPVFRQLVWECGMRLNNVLIRLLNIGTIHNFFK